jgi:hypothetical protein
MTTTDRTTEPAGVFAAHLARWEAAEADPDGTVERVARAIWLASNPAIPMVLTPEQIDSTWRHAQTVPMTAEYRQIAAAAIAALRPAPDAPRDARLAAVLDLADELELTAHDEEASRAVAMWEAADRIRAAVAAPLAGHDNEDGGR